ncbi:MAG TPA: dienelactone hydrolase family protein [Iamia sp.]|nr:dienelactone hydrolase family protein [Iamia sp.]
MSSTTLPSGTPAYVASTPDATRGVVIVPDIGGLRPLFTDLCDRLAAEHGWTVGCFDSWAGRSETNIEEKMAAAGSLDDATVMGDATATADLLGVEPVAVIGFCQGGMFAFKGAASGRFDRAVSFYGMVRLPEHWSTATMAEPLDVLAAAGDPAPILMIVGTDDPYVPAADADDLEATGAEVVRYEGAGHGFAHDADRPAHRADDAADAWRRVAAFLG